MIFDDDDWIRLWKELGPQERNVLKRIAFRTGERLLIGQRLYGRLDLQNDTRNLVREANDETIDNAIYLACEEIRREITE